MSRAITWRNVNGPALDEATKAMFVAQNGINKSFDMFNDTLKQKLAFEEQDQAALKEKNMADFMGQAMRMQSPEEYDAWMKSGEGMRTLEGYGDNIDRLAALKFKDARFGELTEQAKTRDEREDYSIDRQQRDEVESLVAMMYQNPEGARQLLANSPHLRKQGELAEKMYNRLQQEVKSQYDKENHHLGLRKGNAEIGKIGAQTGLYNAQTANTWAQEAHQQLQNADFAENGPVGARRGSSGDRPDNTGLYDPKADNIFAGGTGATDAARKTVDDAIKANGIDLDSTKAARIRRTYNEIAQQGGTPLMGPNGELVRDGQGEPVMIPAIASIFASSIAKSYGQFLGTRAGNSKTDYEQYLSSPEGQREILLNMSQLAGPQGRWAQQVLLEQGINQPQANSSSPVNLPRPAVESLSGPGGNPAMDAEAILRRALERDRPK